MEIQTEEISKGNDVTLTKLHDSLPSVDKNITMKDYNESDEKLNGTYKIDGQEFEFTINKNLNVKIGEPEKTVEEAFSMTVTDVDKTSLRATGDETKLNELGATEFTYVASTSGSGDIKYEHITEKSYEITGLEPDTDYIVYMLAYDNAGNVKKSNEVKITTKKLKIQYTAIAVSTSSSSSNTSSLEANKQEKGTPLYINIIATLEGNKCTVVLKADNSKTVPYAVTENGKYTFVVRGTYNGKTIEEEKEVVVNQYMSAKEVVKYDAGDWTKEEIEELQTQKLYDINKSKKVSYKYKLNDDGINFTFGGFTYKGDTANASDIASGNIITSRNQSATSQDGKAKYEGWQVLETEEKDGKRYIKKIVHSGCPENFSYKETENYSSWKAEYLLSSGLRKKDYNEINGVKINSRNWQMYIDVKQKNLIADILDENGNKIKDINAMTSSDLYLNTDIGVMYILANANVYSRGYYKYGSLDMIYEKGLHNPSNVYVTQECLGIRPVVTMAEGVYIKSGSGTEEDPYILGKD